MHNFNNEIYHLWRPDLDEVVHYAIKQRSPVEVRCHWPLDKCNSADLALFGRFLAIRNYQAQFLVDNFDLSPARNFPIPPECEYLFSASHNLDGSGNVRMEYAGKAVILDSELQKNDIPAGLLLRINFPTCARRMRQHDRLECPQDLAAMPGLMLIGKTPPGRRELLALLGHYYQDRKRPRPRLVNISAGGVCLQTEDPRCQRFIGADENYLFFFFPGNVDQLICPSVFVGKKVGFFRGGDSRKSGLRIKFLRELLWTRPEDELKWLDIEKDGSENLRAMLAGYDARHS